MLEPAQARAMAPAAGQTLYVPAYSTILTASRPQFLNLAITLCIRNTDEDTAIVVRRVHFFDQDGKLLRDFQPQPLRLGPLAAAEWFVSGVDARGDAASCFLVEWIAAEPVTPPVVEAIMVGAANNQGVSFTCPGRVLTDRSRKPESEAEVPDP